MVSEVEHVRHGLLNLQFLHSLADWLEVRADLRSVLELWTEIVLDVDILVQSDARVVFTTIDVLVRSTKRLSILEKSYLRPGQSF